MLHGMLIALITVTGVALGGILWVILLAMPGRDERRRARMLRAGGRPDEGRPRIRASIRGRVGARSER